MSCSRGWDGRDERPARSPGGGRSTHLPEITVAREVGASAKRTWAVATDLAHAVDVITAITALERLDGGDAFALGTRWRETRRMFGREATEEMAVTHLDPGRSYVVESDSGGTHYVSKLSVDALGEARSRIEMSFDAESSGLVARALEVTIGRLLVGSLRKELARDLADIAAAAERDA